jgi:hypothetical protein
MNKLSHILCVAAASLLFALNIQASAAVVNYIPVNYIPQVNTLAQETVAQTQSRTAPDNSIITVEESNGTRTETRTFNDPDSSIARIVRTTNADGTRRTLIYFRNGQMRRMNEGTDENILEETGDALAGFAEAAVDVTQEVAGETAETAKDVAQGAGEAAGVVRERTVEGAKATAEIGKGVAQGTRTAAERAGSATGKAVEQTVETGGKVAKGTGKVVAKSADATGNAIEKTADVAGDVASGTVKTSKKTAKGAATATSKTVDAAESTGHAVGRGLRAIGRGFKKGFGS